MALLDDVAPETKEAFTTEINNAKGLDELGKIPEETGLSLITAIGKAIIAFTWGGPITAIVYLFRDKFKSVITAIVDGIKGLIPSFFGGSLGKQSQPQTFSADFMSRPGQAIANFSPDDTIIGVKDPSKLFNSGGKSNITVNVNAIDGSSISSSVLTKISQAVQEGITRNMSGASSQAWGY